MIMMMRMMSGEKGADQWQGQSGCECITCMVVRLEERISDTAHHSIESKRHTSEQVRGSIGIAQ